MSASDEAYVVATVYAAVYACSELDAERARHRAQIAARDAVKVYREEREKRTEVKS